jgi:hypothetical protein
MPVVVDPEEVPVREGLGARELEVCRLVGRDPRDEGGEDRTEEDQPEPHQREPSAESEPLVRRDLDHGRLDDADRVEFVVEHGATKRF